MIIGMVLLSAALSKLIAPAEVFQSLGWVFGSPTSGPIGIGLVAVELTLGVALLFGLHQSLCLALAALLFLLFTLWIAFLFASGAPVGCGCGVGWSSSPERAASSRPDLVGIAKALFFMALSSVGYAVSRAEPNPKRLFGMIERSPS